MINHKLEDREGGKHGHGCGHGNRKGHGGYCVCTQCGYHEVHIAGVPCRTVFCPTCQIPLVRSDTPHLKDGDILHSHHHSWDSLGENHDKLKSIDQLDKPPKKTLQIFPYVIPEKCIGCGRCMDVCPTSTITMKSGVAFVHQENCKSCFVCLRVCPTEAFVKVEK